MRFSRTRIMADAVYGRRRTDDVAVSSVGVGQFAASSDVYLILSILSL